ncbi:FAD-binding oxidoreductase [Actinoplanes sp. NPDC051851]|uniref:FAD-binding oxidoreductase n=1 Tax=Actinoplanes sp. NPDC051851 TaxID=3154753 RepID=UPI0034127CD6
MRHVRRGEADYETLRKAAVWNARKPDRHPEVIVVAHEERDVVDAVRYAATHHLTIGIRSGGHSWVGNGIRDGGMLLDLSHLTEITVDGSTARVQPSAKGPDIYRAVSEHGWFFPTGHAPTVGIGGFILGGGYGWNSRALGPACLSIEAVDVVLADGSLVHATDESHPDLMWAVRGSGPGFFGVVTRFHLRLHPHPEAIRRTVHRYPASMHQEVLAFTREALDHLPREVEISAKVTSRHAMLTATAFGETGSLAYLEGAPFRNWALGSTVNEPITVPGLYDLADALNPQGMRWSLDGVWLDGPESVPLARELNETVPPGHSFVLWMVWGSFPVRENACWSAQGEVYLSPNAGWTDPAEDLAMESWTSAPLERIQEHSRGLQFSDNNLADRWDQGLRPEQAERLEKVRATYDPDRRFHTYMRPEESTTAYARTIRATRARSR